MSRSRASSEASDARGRARSRTFSHEADSGFGAEIDLLNAELDGKSPEEIEQLKQAAVKAAAPAPLPNSGVSTRALKIVSGSLDAALAHPDEDHDSGSRAPGKALEEEEEELRLEEAEKRKRQAQAEKDGGAEGGGGGSSRSSGSGTRGGSRKKGGQDHDVVIKLLLLGNSGVGKTSLMMRFADDKFSPSMMSTAGVDYQTAYLDIGGKRVKLQVWDTAGQQRFNVIMNSFYKGSHGIILVYDVVDDLSFKDVSWWMDNISKNSSPGLAKILIGNKVDLKGRKVDTQSGQQLAESFGLRFAETSAKDGQGVRDAFTTCATDALAAMLGGAGGGGAEGGAAHAGVAKPGDKDKKDCTVM